MRKEHTRNGNYENESDEWSESVTINANAVVIEIEIGSSFQNPFECSLQYLSSSSSFSSSLGCWHHYDYDFSDVTCDLLIHPEADVNIDSNDIHDIHSNMILIPETVSVPISGIRDIHLTIPVPSSSKSGPTRHISKYWTHFISCETTVILTRNHTATNNILDAKNLKENNVVKLQVPLETSVSDFVVIDNSYNHEDNKNSMQLQFLIDRKTLNHLTQSTLCDRGQNQHDNDEDSNISHSYTSFTSTQQEDDRIDPINFVTSSSSSFPTFDNHIGSTPFCCSQHQSCARSLPVQLPPAVGLLLPINITPLVIILILMMICFIDLYIHTMQRRYYNPNAKSPIHQCIIILFNLWIQTKILYYDIITKGWQVFSEQIVSLYSFMNGITFHFGKSQSIVTTFYTRFNMRMRMNLKLIAFRCRMVYYSFNDIITIVCCCYSEIMKTVHQWESFNRISLFFHIHTWTSLLSAVVEFMRDFSNFIIVRNGCDHASKLKENASSSSKPIGERIVNESDTNSPHGSSDCNVIDEKFDLQRYTLPQDENNTMDLDQDCIHINEKEDKGEKTEVVNNDGDDAINIEITKVDVRDKAEKVEPWYNHDDLINTLDALDDDLISIEQSNVGDDEVEVEKVETFHNHNHDLISNEQCNIRDNEVVAERVESVHNYDDQIKTLVILDDNAGVVTSEIDDNEIVVETMESVNNDGCGNPNTLDLIECTLYDEDAGIAHEQGSMNDRDNTVKLENNSCSEISQCKSLDNLDAIATEQTVVNEMKEIAVIKNIPQDRSCNNNIEVTLQMLLQGDGSEIFRSTNKREMVEGADYSNCFVDSSNDTQTQNQSNVIDSNKSVDCNNGCVDEEMTKLDESDVMCNESMDSKISSTTRNSTCSYDNKENVTKSDCTSSRCNEEVQESTPLKMIKSTCHGSSIKERRLFWQKQYGTPLGNNNNNNNNTGTKLETSFGSKDLQINFKSLQKTFASNNRSKSMHEMKSDNEMSIKLKGRVLFSKSDSDNGDDDNDCMNTKENISVKHQTNSLQQPLVRPLSPCSRLQKEWFEKASTKNKRDDNGNNVKSIDADAVEKVTVKNQNFSSLMAKWSQPVNKSLNSSTPIRKSSHSNKRIVKALSPAKVTRNESTHDVDTGKAVPLSFLNDLLE